MDNLYNKPLISKEEFMRMALIELYRDDDTPPDIDSAEFTQVEESIYQFVNFYGTYDVTIQGEIGYDHDEQYLVEEKYYDADLKTYRTRTVPKTRTVTHWQPYTGTDSAYGFGATEIANNDTVDLGDLSEENKKRYNDYAYDANEVARGESLRSGPEYDAIDFVTPSEAKIQTASRNGMNRCSFHIPGDHKRKIRYDYTVANPSVYVSATKRYKTAFDFCGERFFIKQFANEKTPTLYFRSSWTEERKKKLSDERTKAAETDALYQDYMKKSKMMFIAAIAALIAGFALGNFLGLIGLLGLPAAAVLVYLAYKNNQSAYKRQQEIYAEYAKKEKAYMHDLRQKKAQLLNTRLVSMHLEPLTNSEISTYFPQPAEDEEDE